MTVTLQDVQHLDLHEVGDLVFHAFCEGNQGSAARLNSPGAILVKGRSAGQRNVYLEFWAELFRTSSADKKLFSMEGPQEGLKLQGTNGLSLFHFVSELLATFSGLRARAFRIVATEAGLQLITSLVQAVKVNADTRDLKQRQMDAEAKKARPNISMIKSLKEGISLMQIRICELELMIRYVFEKLFTHRFRDADPNIRAACMTSIGCWMRDHPLLFLSDFYLKYLGWSLNDKDSSVRLAALSSLCTLYDNSSENLAIMDTFNSRFIPRICEMIRDTDSSVVVKAVEAMKLLYEASILPRQDMEPVLALLLDEEVQIRVAIAALIPILTPSDLWTTLDGVKKAEDHGTYLRRQKSQHIYSTHATLLFIIQVIKMQNGGSRARTASIVDALWDSQHMIFTDWNLICDLLLSENDQIANYEAARGRALDTIDAVILSNILVCSVRRAVGEKLINCGINRYHPIHQTKTGQLTNGQRYSNTSRQECFTQAYASNLLALLQRWKSDEAVVGPLIEILQYLKLEHFSLKRREADYGRVLQCIGDIFLQHSSRRVADACTNTLFYAITERASPVCTFGTQTCKFLFKSILQAFQDIQLARNAAEAASERLIRGKEDAKQVSAGEILQNRIMLLRLNSLLTHVPLAEICNTAELCNELLKALLTNISDVASRIPTGAKLEIVLLSIRAASLILVHQMVSIVESDATVAALLREHIALRDAFLEATILLLRKTHQAKSSNILSKAIISTITAVIIYYQHVCVVQSNCQNNPAKDSMLISLKFLPSDGMIHALWEACNHIFDIPLEGRHGGITEDRCIGEDAAQMGYNLAMCDTALSDHARVPAELLANRGHSGNWADCAIDALMSDLRLLGPHASGNTIITSLASAFEELGFEKQQTGTELQEAFGELANNLADLFTVGSQRDRMIVRCIIEEGLKFVVPGSSPNPTRMRFLPLGLGGFIAKLASVDAKKLMKPLNGVIAVVDRADKDIYTPLFDFVKLVAGRSRGVAG